MELTTAGDGRSLDSEFKLELGEGETLGCKFGTELRDGEEPKEGSALGFQLGEELKTGFELDELRDGFALPMPLGVKLAQDG